MIIVTLAPSITSPAFQALDLILNKAWMKQVNISPEPKHDPRCPRKRIQRLIVLSFHEKWQDGFLFGSDSDVLLASQPSPDDINRTYSRIGFDFQLRALMVFDLSSHFTVIESESLGIVT